MQLRRAFVVLACAAWCSDAALFLRTASLAESQESDGDWTASLLEAESEDRSFLVSQLDQTESQLIKLQEIVAGAPAAPVKAVAEKKVEVDTKVAAKPAVAKAAEKPVVAKAAPTAKDAAKAAKNQVTAALGKAGGTAALAMQLAMLKGLYQDSKDRISQQNVREDKSKKWFAEKETAHKLKMDTIEGKFKNHTLSEEFRTNETRDETRYFTYWSRCRERQHRQFHTNLKIQHAMMMKTKKMIDMYENAISTKPADQAKAKKELQSASGGMPEIVFLQQSVGSFCRDSLVEVRKERAELQDLAQQAY